MLVATSEARLGDAGVLTTGVFERAVRGVVVRRDALAFDTRFAVASAGRLERVGHVFVMTAGRLVTDRGERYAAPVGFVLGDDEIERPRPGSRTFRTDGAHVDVIQLRFTREHLRAPIGLSAGPLALPAAVLDAAHRFLANAPRGDVDALAGVLDALAGAGIIEGGLASTLCADEPERFQRSWEALRAVHATHGAGTSLKQVAASLDMSQRQVMRDFKALTAQFGIGRGGYRSAILVLRLRVAVILLGAPSASITEVARLVGYGSPIALARAFRDAGLPAPSAIHAALHGAGRLRDAELRASV